jgi:hypothetical protein
MKGNKDKTLNKRKIKRTQKKYLVEKKKYSIFAVGFGKQRW